MSEFLISIEDRHIRLEEPWHSAIFIPEYNRVQIERGADKSVTMGHRRFNVHINRARSLSHTTTRIVMSCPDGFFKLGRWDPHKKKIYYSKVDPIHLVYSCSQDWRRQSQELHKLIAISRSRISNNIKELNAVCSPSRP